VNRSFLIGVAIAAVLVTMGYKGTRVLDEKAKQQQAASDSVKRWKQSYKALLNSTREYNQRYPDLAKFDDILGLYQSIHLGNYKLHANPDILAITRAEPVMSGGVPVGLARICLASNATNAEAALEVGADSYLELLDGISALAARPDIEIGGVSIKGKDKTPTASLGNFCLLLRQGGAA